MLRIGKKPQTKSFPFVKWSGTLLWISTRGRFFTANRLRWPIRRQSVGSSGTPTYQNRNRKRPPCASTTTMSHRDREGRRREKHVEAPIRIAACNSRRPASWRFLTLTRNGRRQAIGDRDRIFREAARRPIVQLEVRETIKDGKTISVPSTSSGPTRAMTSLIDHTRGRRGPLPRNGATAPESKRNDDMDDDIPF